MREFGGFWKYLDNVMICWMIGIRTFGASWFLLAGL